MTTSLILCSFALMGMIIVYLSRVTATSASGRIIRVHPSKFTERISLGNLMELQVFYRDMLQVKMEFLTYSVSGRQTVKRRSAYRLRLMGEHCNRILMGGGAMALMIVMTFLCNPIKVVSASD